MWSKRKDEEIAPRPGYAPPAQAEPAREGIPHSAQPARSTAEASRGAANIGKSVSIKGQILGREDLVVDGELEGSIELPEHRLTIGANGRLKAGLKAREIVVLGEIQGNVEALDLIEIRKDARLVGDIRTARIVIEDGAYFKGSIDIVKPEPPKVSVAAPKAPAAVPAAAAPVANPGSAGR